MLPRLESANHFLNENSRYTVRYAVKNTGLGPAVLRDFIVFHDSVKVFDAESDPYYSFSQVGQELRQLPFQSDAFTATYSVGQMLEVGEEHVLIGVEIPYASFDNVDSLDYRPPNRVRDEVINRRSFVFCYCSVYGEDCGMTFLGAPPPTEDVCGF